MHAYYMQYTTLTPHRSNFVPDHYQALSDLINLTNKYGKDDEIVGHIHTLKAPVYNSLIKQRSCKIIL